MLEGIRIDRLKIADVTIEKLYLKWENALLIKAEKIDLSELKRDDAPLTLEPLSKLPPFIRHFQRWVQDADINMIQYQDIRLSLHYHENRPGIFDLRLNGTHTKGEFNLDERVCSIVLPDTRYKGGTLSGRMEVSLQDETIDSTLILSLPETPLLHITASGDRKRLRVSLRADAPIKDVAPILDFFALDPDIRPWIADAAEYETVTLKRLSGSFSYDTPEELLDTLSAEAVVQGARYTFADGIEPIHAPEVFLDFKHGRLNIIPRTPTFYTLPADDSWLYIDFKTPHTMLEARIKSQHAKLNDPILNLLSHYKIRLPLKQQSGECAVDLNLSINLYDLATTAVGTFKPSSSQILLDKILLNTEGGVVRLNHSLVTFDGFSANYGNGIAHAAVSGRYDASTEKGNILIDADSVMPTGNPSQLALLTPAMPMHVAYTIDPKGDYLNVSPSNWSLMGNTLRLGGFKTPFDYRKVSMSIASIPFTYNTNAKGSVKAKFDGVNKLTELDLRLDTFNSDEISLSAAPFDLHIRYDGVSTLLESPNASAWSVHRLSLLLSPFSAALKGDDLTIARIDTVLDDSLKGSVVGTYNIASKKGALRLSNLQPLRPDITPYVDPRQSVNLYLDAAGEYFTIDAPSFKTRLMSVENGWKASLSDISLLSRRSPMLRKYGIENGHMDILYTGERSLYNFSGEIDYPYQIMMINDAPVSRYRFTGTYQGGKTMIRVNNRVVINHTDSDTNIKANNAGINLPELFRFLSAQSGRRDSGPEADELSSSITINAAHTYLYLMERRKIVADSLYATLEGDNFDATLDHMDGHATLKIRSGLFSITGYDFNDRFMDHLFAFSDFYGGRFSFQAKGAMDAFDGIMRVENTVLKDYRLLNNILAFINTIPSLATFSLPNYHTKGLPVSEGYAHFTYEKGKIDVDNLTINSPEMKIAGETHADMKSDTINGTMTLKTDLGSKLAKVPMVGYILFGKDGSVSTTVTISGKIEDPKVQTAIAKEIATAPFNILKRTLVYPFLWMIDDEKKK